MIQCSRSEAPGEKVDTLIEFLRHAQRPRRLARHGGMRCRLHVKRLEVEAQRGHLLTKVIVDIPRNATPLVFLRANETPEQRVDLRRSYPHAFFDFITQ